MKKKLTLLMLVLLIVCTVLTLVAGCTKTPEKQAATGSKLYVGYTTDADKFIAVPNLRQYGDYTCGTTCVQMLMNYLYPQAGDKNLSAYEKELGTTPENGTTPQQIYDYFIAQGVDVEKKDNLSIEKLVAAIDGGHPVMMCIQAWSDQYNTTDPDSANYPYLQDGHWVIAVGYQKTDQGYQFYFNDPACVGHCLMSQSDLETRWIDMDGAGTIYNHFGFIIKGTTEYQDTGVFYLK